MRFATLILTLLTAILVAIPSTGWAQTALDINSLRIGSDANRTRMVIELSQGANFRAFYLSSPPRVVVDLPTFSWKAGTQKFPANSIVKAVRQGALQPGISRIVVETDTNVHLRDAFFLSAEKNLPNRIVIDFSKATSTVTPQERKSFGSLTEQNAKQNLVASNAPAKASQNSDHVLRLPPGKKPEQTKETMQSSNSNINSQKTDVTPDAAPIAAPLPPPNSKLRKRTIVLDPGHGGQDPGALGHSGHKEKNITLAAAKALKEYLDKTGRYNVHLTRSNDVFIKLQDRVKIARRHNADLFISIHADSIDKAGVHGASIYTLSNTASDAQTAKLAARENRADLIAGVDLSNEDKEVADILIDLAMRDTMNQSKFFANTVVTNISNHGIDLLERPHRYAGFAVLKAPDTPSVLIEIGFMSNKNEVNRLSSPEHRKKLANAIGGAIDSYFTRVEKIAAQ
jgi:N-acetylmuramoyl-L-alanine amidase